MRSAPRLSSSSRSSDEVVGHDDVGALADEEAVQVHAKLAQRLHLVEQAARVHHDAVADDAGDVGMQDAGGHEMEGELLLAMDDAVARVAAALIAHDIVGARSASSSMILPLPSSPHWAPTTAMTLMRDVLSGLLINRLAALLDIVE